MEAPAASTVAVTATDASRLKTILAMLRRGEWKLEGEEVLAFAQATHWLCELERRIGLALAPPPPAPPAAVEAPKARRKG